MELSILKTSYTNVRSKQSYTNAQYASNKGNASISASAEEHIQELKKEIASLKTGNNHEAPKNDLPAPHNPRDITQQQPSQTELPRKELQPGEVISFIEATLKTLNEFKNQFVEQENTKKTHWAM